MRHHLIVIVSAVSLAAGCSGRSGAGSRPSADEYYQRCNTNSENTKPLLVEWPSTQRGELEAELGRRRSLIVVRYTGCEMEVLRGCEVEGDYTWTSISPKQDRIEIRNAGDVWAKIPLAAATLITAVERYGALRLDMQLIGQYSGTDSPPARELLTGSRCDEATHVIGSLMVGAFEITSAKGGSFRAGAEVHGAGAGTGTSRHEGHFSSDGDMKSCGHRGYEYHYGPPENCKSLLQIELLPISTKTTAPSNVCPANMAFVEYEQGGDFCLDLHEVTVEEYGNCAADHTCAEAPATVDWPGIEQHDRHDDLCNTNRGSRRNHPVNCVTWDQAASYCRAQGKRLPTVWEWQWAARGGEQNRTYPWGEDQPGPDRVNACGKECGKALGPRPQAFDKSDGAVGTAAIGSYRAGIGRWGLLDMSGNVAEWTESSDWGMWILGGSALSGSAEELGNGNGEKVAGSTRRFDVGFRCAADPTQAESGKRGRRR